MATIFMTIAEASEFAKVTEGTIRYHINKSEKLYPIDDGYGLKVLRREVEELYPASKPGQKQKNKAIRKNRELTIKQISNMIADAATKGDFHAVEFLSETLKII